MCDEYGLVTMQMALANPPDPLRNPPLAGFVNAAQQQIKAWIREQIAKQHRHERNVFLMEFFILVFVFIEVARTLVGYIKGGIHALF